MHKQDLNNEASVGIYISTFLGTVALFFAGILISRFDNFDATIRVPILLLLVSTFGFVFSSIVYANMTGEARVTEKQDDDDFVRTGNILSEFVGLYPFILSIPLVVNAITNDTFLRSSALMLTVLSIFLYTVSRYSLVRRVMNKVSVIIFATAIVCVLSTAAYVQESNSQLFNLLGLGILLIMVIMMSILPNRKI